MNRMYRRITGAAVFFSVLYLLLPVSGTSAEEPAVAEFRDQVYRQQLDDEQLYRLYLSAVDRLGETAEETAGRVFSLAEAAYYMGRAYHSFDDPDTVIAHYNDTVRGKWHSLRDYYSARENALEMYTRAHRLAERYLRLSFDSRGCRLYAEVAGQMVLLNDIGFLIKTGPQIRKYIEKAIELDPSNTKARILYAGEKIYTPRLFGGNPKEGIEMLLEIDTSCERDREDRFNIYSGIGYAYAALGERNQARRWFLRAGEVYPGNVFAKGMAEVME
jgi:tetratricopeptide (TPR) repeat protein